MNTSDSTQASTLWSDAPSRSGAAWLLHNTRRQCRQLWRYALNRFVGLLGATSTPGVRHVGLLQAWALRRMGACCPSSEIWIGPNVWFEHPEHLVLGRRVTIAADSRITAHATVELGDDFLAAPGLVVNAGSHDIATLRPSSAPIVVEAGVWCASRVTICAGVTVGGGAIIGAGSVVVKNLPPDHVCVGVPCKATRAIGHLRDGVTRPWSNFRRST